MITEAHGPGQTGVSRPCFALERGVSFTIRKSSKPGLYRRMRGAAFAVAAVVRLVAHRRVRGAG